MKAMTLENYTHIVMGLLEECQAAMRGEHPNAQAADICRQSIIETPLPFATELSGVSPTAIWGRA